MLLGNRYIVAMDEQPMAALGAGASYILEELFEPGDDLLKCLFANGSRRSSRIEMMFIHAF